MQAQRISALSKPRIVHNNSTQQKKKQLQKQITILQQHLDSNPYDAAQRKQLNTLELQLKKLT